VCIAVFNILNLEYMYERTVYLFMAQLFWLVMDIPRAWMKTVEDGWREEYRP
jgi:hypothetical protein